MAIAVTFALLNGIYFHRLPLFRPLSRDEAIGVQHDGDTILVPIERPNGL